MLAMIMDNLGLIIVFLGAPLAFPNKRVFRHSRKIGVAIIVIGFGVIVYQGV